uniref:C2H2-type domain-containing protein n=1 Tax=Mycena chlorophos TaxID=658473 RepID=A0ABQ0L7N3_MYCCL|nr:predicted protein [Mycena chlorophos]
MEECPWGIHGCTTYVIPLRPDDNAADHIFNVHDSPYVLDFGNEYSLFVKRHPVEDVVSCPRCPWEDFDVRALGIHLSEAHGFDSSRLTISQPDEPSPAASHSPPRRMASSLAPATPSRTVRPEKRIKMDSDPISDAMDVDAEESDPIESDPGVPEAPPPAAWTSHELLTPLHLLHHPALRVLLCTDCPACVIYTHAVAHAQSKHGFRASKDARKTLQDDIDATFSSLCVSRPADVVDPSPASPPIPLLPVLDGWHCPTCGFASHKERTLDNHCYKPDHKLRMGKKDSSPAFCVVRCKVQTLHPEYHHYFVVQPALASLAPGHPFVRFQAIHAHDFVKPDALFGAPVGNDVTPLHKITNWHEHLRPYLAHQSTLVDLQSLTDTAHLLKKASRLSVLPAVCLRYQILVSQLVTVADFPALCLLMDWPRLNNSRRYFKAHTLPDTLQAYTSILVSLVHALVCSVAEDCPTAYRFPLSDKQRSAIDALSRGLGDAAPDNAYEADALLQEQVSALHAVASLVLLAREQDNPAPRLSQGKFDSVLQCFLAVFSFQKDGILKP